MPRLIRLPLVLLASLAAGLAAPAQADAGEARGSRVHQPEPRHRAEIVG